MSLRGEVWAHKTSLTPAPFIEIPVHESEWSCICVFGVSISPLSTILILVFGTFPTSCYALSVILLEK
jgi:hypothetical protein